MIQFLTFLILFISPLKKDELKESIHEAKISFELPSKDWHLVARQESGNMLIYFYKRAPITDSAGRNVIPNISFILEDVDEEMDVVTYSAMKRSNVPFEVQDVFTHNDKSRDLKFKNAVGYFGKYNDDAGLSHSVYVVHLINNGKGVQLICDITSELFQEYGSEFESVIRSLEAEK